MTKQFHNNSHAISYAIDAPTTLRAADARDTFAEQREQFVMNHLPIVRFIARRIHERLPQHILIEDFYGAGVVGLLDAMDKFDSSREIRFRIYTQFRIRGAVLDSLRTLDWSPRNLRRQKREIEDAIQVVDSSVWSPPE
jgi:RNA polymerase sigma factor for flagellar operon FliA